MGLLMVCSEMSYSKSKSEPEDKLISRSALAERWGLSKMSIRRREQSGALAFLKLGKCVRFRLTEIERIEKEAEVRL